MKDLSECRVLIVDDVKANVDVLVAALKGEYRLSVALDGASALKNATANPPDLVLLDILMPGIDGFEVCRRLRATAATRGNRRACERWPTAKHDAGNASSARPPQPRLMIRRRPAAPLTSAAVLARASSAGMLPKPTKIGGSPAARNASTSSGSGVSSSSHK